MQHISQQIFNYDTLALLKVCKYSVFSPKVCKYGVFSPEIRKYNIFVAKTCKNALIGSFEGSAAVIDNSAN